VKTLKTGEAAALLNVSPNTIRAWERRFGFPRPARSPGRHRAYSYAELVALNDALRDGLSISSAISVAREGLESGLAPLVRAFARLEGERADRVMEAALSLQSLPRAVEETLLPAVALVREHNGPGSVAYAFAIHWGRDWLTRARRLTLPPDGTPPTVLIGNAALGDADAVAPYVAALELICTHRGCRVLILPVHALTGIAATLERGAPAAAIVTGGGAPDAIVERWARAISRLCPDTPLAVFRRDTESPALAHAIALAPSPSVAAARLVALTA
jgi:DNA-binding transcriptional MerR regulator